MTTRRLFTALFLVSLFTIAIRDTLDPDMWWHLRTGEYIMQEGIPHEDIFSFTVPDHEWITHEWLSQVIMWNIYQAGGWAGLILFFAAIITATFTLVYAVTPGRPFLAAFVVLLAAIASAIVWGVRPQMFNLLLTAVFLFLVERVKAGKMDKRAFWLLPPLTILWANLHSGYLLGIVVLATYTIGEALQQWRGGDGRTLSWSSIRLLGAMAVLSFLAAALNPNSIQLWIYPFLTLGSSAMQAYIVEWHSPDFHRNIFWPFVAMAALGIIGMIFSNKRPSWTDILLFGGTAAAGLMSARNIPLFAVIAAPIVARYLLSSVEKTAVYPTLSGESSTNPPSRLMAALNWLILITVVFASLLWTVDKIGRNETAVDEQYPSRAVTYLQESGLADQRGYNQYGWGGYLIWHGIPVFVDGRADVYGDVFLDYYMQTFKTTETWREPLDEYDIQYVLMAKNTPLTILLKESTDWHEAYNDDLAQIFIRADK